MPVTPFLTVPDTPRSQMIYNNEECRRNAMKIRQENDWFGHSDKPMKKQSQNQTCSSHYSNEQHRISRPSSARWWNDVGEVDRVSRHCTPESRRIQEKLEAHNQHDWYKHGPGVPDPPPLNKKGIKSRKAACSEARARMAGGDPNDWFKHESNSMRSPGNGSMTPSSEASKGSLSSSRRNKDLAGSITWLLNDSPTTPTTSPPKRDPYPFDIDSGSPATEVSQKVKYRVISPDADCYQRRNNEGSASQWYIQNSSDVPPQSRQSRKMPTKFAIRLDAESEDWYSFRDASRSLTNLTFNSDCGASPTCDSSQKLSRFVANSNVELDLDPEIASNMDLNEVEKSKEGDANPSKHSKWNLDSKPPQKQYRNGFKHFVRLDDYFEPTWSVTSGDNDPSSQKL